MSAEKPPGSCHAPFGWCLSGCDEPHAAYSNPSAIAPPPGIAVGETGRILSLYLIDPRGLPIAGADLLEGDLDPYVVSGMISAIGIFVRDVMARLGGSGDSATLNRLGFGDYVILIETVPSGVSLITLLHGPEDPFFVQRSQRLLAELLDEYGDEVENWNGARLLPIQERIEAYVRDQEGMGFVEGAGSHEAGLDTALRFLLFPPRREESDRSSPDEDQGKASEDPNS